MEPRIQKPLRSVYGKKSNNWDRGALCFVATFLKVDYVDAMISLARVLRRSKQPRQPSSINRLGFSLNSSTTKDGFNGALVNFMREHTVPQNIRAALIRIVQPAKE